MSRLERVLSIVEGLGIFGVVEGSLRMTLRENDSFNVILHDLYGVYFERSQTVLLKVGY